MLRSAGRITAIPHALVATLLCAAASAAPPVSASPSATRAAGPRDDRPVRVLFLGDNADGKGGHHQPARRFAQLQPVLAVRGIEMAYTERLADLDPAVLSGHDVLAVYANIDDLSPDGERAILDFVRGGGGLVPLHCASYCFRNSPAWIDLVGAQFQRHGTGEFRTVVLAPEHPLMRGFGGFASWDETYVHTKHNARGRTVLEERVEGDHHEPWTWVRDEGKGRVFYTAWGHDHRTWGNPGFHELVARGIRFAAGRDPADGTAARPAFEPQPADLAPLEYEPARVPFYVPDAKKGTTAEPLSSMQKPLTPEESRKHVVRPVGFRVELFAAEPLLAAKPLALAFDADGSLFVAESVDYPNDLVEPGQGVGRDRIVRLSDTDGDSRADRRDVFAEGLSIPTSMLAHDRGLIVAQPPHALFLQDTDGDGTADRRKVLFSGWGVADTHAGPNSLAWGLDGWVYGMVGYAGFNGTVGGEPLRFGAGFFRFLPDGSRLEFLRSTNNNSWGLGFSEEGLLFGSTANGNPSEHMPLPNRVYERVRGWNAPTLQGIAGSPKMELAVTPDGTAAPIRQVDHHGRFTAAAGHRLYTARAWPREYWNRAAFVCEPTGHLVATFLLDPRGAAFTSRMAWSLLASDDEWTAPIQAEVGPDGQLWVIDWYNYIVQHNPTPAGFEKGRRDAYVTPLRDKTHGRIWRVVHDPEGRRPSSSLSPAPLPPADSSPEGLVARLADDNLFWRERAQRWLVERAAGRSDVGHDAVPALVALVGDPSTDAIGMNAAAIHAIWTLRQLGAINGPRADAAAVAAVQSAVRHPSAGVRMNAVKALPRNDASLDRLAAAGVAGDESPLVRLALLEALGEWPSSPQAAAVVIGLLDDPRTLADPALADAATSAAAVHAADVLPAVLAAAAGAATVDPKRLVLIERVAGHVARGGAASAVSAVLLRLVRPDARGGDVPVVAAAAAIAGISRGWPKGNGRISPEAERALAPLADRLPAAAQAQLVTLARQAGSRGLDDRVEGIGLALLDLVDRAEATDGERAAAAERLVRLLPADLPTVERLLSRTGSQAGPELSAGLVRAAGLSAAPGAAAAVIDRLGSFTPQVRESAVRTILSNRDWAMLLVVRLEEGAVSVGDIPIAERARLANHPDQSVRDRAKKVLAAGGGLPNADRQRVIDEILPVVLRGGDAARGRAIFKKQCGTCHVHGGEGGRVGPDLTGMAKHPPQELLIHILDPNRSVEGNYRAWMASLADGRVLTGLLAGESRTAIELVDAQGVRTTIQRNEIDELVPSSNSLMPVGFEKQIPAESFADLLAFLSAQPVLPPTESR